MKTYSIGRDLNCDIVINDATDVISRRHALLNVTSSGKMTIIDQSRNGTYVNGIRISPNVPVPVTRKDIISLAHVAKLNWSQVPKANQWIKYAVAGAIAVVIVLIVIFCIKNHKSESGPNGPQNLPASEQIDSIAIKQREAAKADSIKEKQQKDSLDKVAEKARQDSIAAKKQEEQKKKKAVKPKDSDKDKDKAKQDSTRNKRHAVL